MRTSLNWLREFVDISDGVTVLGDKLTMVGLAVDAIEEAGDGDTLLELDITANRGDCLSHLGVAREIAAIYDLEVRLPEFKVDESGPGTEDAVTIDIADPDLCHRYCGRYVEDVMVGPSPEWLSKRLEAIGIRPINNVADVTNYVLMELGQPLHAFDADRLAGRRITVRRAHPGESLRTLDAEERKLDSSALVIADAERAVALAGIMGGADSEISASTRNVLIESAWFDPLSVRRTARSLNLSTEASYRFERGTDIDMTRIACDRAAQLIRELAGGKIGSGVIDVYPESQPRAQVGLRRSRIRAHLGMDVPEAIVVQILDRLGFEITDTEDGWNTLAPSHRHDIAREEDLLEEVARHYGYEKFPATLPSTSASGRRLPWNEAESTLRDLLSGLGYSEACSLVFSDPEIEKTFAPGVNPFVVRNPLSEAEPALRTSLVPSMLKSLRWNVNRGVRDLQFFEIGKVYPSTGERRRLIMAATGARRVATPHQDPLESDFYSLKGDVEALLDRFGLEAAPRADEVPDYYHPGRSVRLGSVAVVGELGPGIQESFKFRQRVHLAEIDVEAVYRAGVRTVFANPIPKYPAIRRDLSLILDRRIRYDALVEAIEAAGVRELIRIDPFDRLDEGPFPRSSYSLAVGLVYQASDRTLTDDEVQGFERRVLTELERIGVRLRT